MDAADKASDGLTSRSDRSLSVGDYVLVRRPKTSDKKELPRFSERAAKLVYRVKAKVGDNTYEVEDSADPGRVLSFPLQNAENLIRVYLPELELKGESQLKRLLIADLSDPEVWHEATVIGLAVDGRVQVQWSRTGLTAWLDLSRCRYKWVLANSRERKEEDPGKGQETSSSA